jgi:hypothetical protein
LIDKVAKEQLASLPRLAVVNCNAWVETDAKRSIEARNMRNFGIAISPGASSSPWAGNAAHKKRPN